MRDDGGFRVDANGMRAPVQISLFCHKGNQLQRTISTYFKEIVLISCN